MRTFIFLFLVLVFTNSVDAQIPNVLNYQAVARNNAGAALSNQTINVRLTLLRNSVSLYSETRQVTTNLLGLFNVQIGSPGATSTTGDITTISWLGNTPNPIMLRVELELTNTNLFTEMGTQAFSTVPFSFGADKSIEVINLAGRYIDPVTVPAINSRLVWSGYAWTPVKKDTTIYLGSSVGTLPAGGANAPWQWAGQTKLITVTGTETIICNASIGMGHASGNFIPVSVDVCYQLQPGGSILAFSAPNNFSPETAIPVNTTAPRTNVSANGSVLLPEGQYKIGVCVKNKSGTGAPLNNNDFVTGVIQVKY